MATAHAGLSSSNDIRAKAGVNDALLTLGRVIFAVLFILSGFAKITDLSATAAMIGSKGLPLPLVLAGATAALELGGGLLIVLGWQTRIVAFVLALFTLTAAYFFHDFWNIAPGAERTDAMVHALKNLSIFGGFLMLAAVGPGRYSIDGPCMMHEPNS